MKKKALRLQAVSRAGHFARSHMFLCQCQGCVQRADYSSPAVQLKAE